MSSNTCLLGLVIFIVVPLLLAVFNALGASSTQETSASDGADDSHIYYRNAHGDLVHESEACSGCMANYAQQLREKGVEVEEVVIAVILNGRR